MYQFFLSTCFLLLITVISNAQLSEGGRPLSNNLIALKATSSLPVIKLKNLDIESLIEQNRNLVPERYGIYKDTLIDIKKSGKADIIPSLGQIWRLKISNSNAKAIQPLFSRFILPEGAKVFLYNEDQSRLAGAFTKRNMKNDLSFAVADFEGNHVIIEYFEPLNAEYTGEIIIGAIGQAFKEALTAEAATEFIDINCPIGKDAQLLKHAVCRISFKVGTKQYSCSGALINNTENDGKPYFLTANHCISSPAHTAGFIAYFNYENAGCNGDLLPYQTLSGATLLSTGKTSDYTLLLLSETPTREYQPYYAGWDFSNSETDSVTGVHLPGTYETKKVSIDFDSIRPNDLPLFWLEDESQSPLNSHWAVGFDLGKTAPGSSGSPLFNKKGQIIGQLHGGNDMEDYYGMLSSSYSYKPPRLHTVRHYLDPDSTGVKTLGGYTPSGNIPDAFFVAQFEQFCQNSAIAFTDYSVFEPFVRTWTIAPATYNFVNGTSSASKNPVIQFLDDTEYTVALNLRVGGVIKSTETLKVLSGKNLKLGIRSNSADPLCDCDFTNIKLTANGAQSFKWEILPEDINKVSYTNTSGDSTTLKRKPEYITSDTYSFGLRLIGSQGTCIDTAVFSFDALIPLNDAISKAILLDYGNSELYSNVCATDEVNEPFPPNTSCTSQNAWCGCSMGNVEIVDILENSVWFKFIAGSTGHVSIESTGMDNQIALYEAESFTDIIEGNFELIAANDDQATSNPDPLIKSASVIPGKTYWIQVDGSACGEEGNFYITINELAPVANEQPVYVENIVYPQPATNRVFISNPSWESSSIDISVYSSAGSLMVQQKFEKGLREIGLDVSSWEPGIYIARIRNGNKQTIAKIVKK